MKTKNLHYLLFLLNVFLTLLTMTLFCVFELPYLTSNVSISIPIVAIPLFVLLISMLFKTAFTDPGIVPRAESYEVEAEDEGTYDEEEEQYVQVVIIRGQPIKLKYCPTCCIFRPPRASHCRYCDNCVLNFDHHCPWLANCIGLRNYRHYYMFLIAFTLLDAFIGFCVFLHLYLLSQRDTGFGGAVRESPLSLLTAALNFGSFWPMLYFVYFHTKLIALGQTTHEYLKSMFDDVRSPYTAGNYFKNLHQIMCSSEPPSLLNSRKSKKDGPIIYVSRKQ